MAEQDPAKPEASSEQPARNAAEQLAAEALKAAQNAIAGLTAPAETPAAPAPTPAPAASQPAPSVQGAKPFSPPPIQPGASSGKSEGIDLLSDVDLEVKIELGRTRMFVEDVLKLKDGAVVELDKLAGDPVDVYVNDRPVARGEVLILNDNFCVRINEILSGTEAE